MSWNWNYRVVKRSADEYGEETYHIYECYYWPDQSIRFSSSVPASPFGESYDELKENMHQMAEAFHKPVIEWKEEWE